MWRAPKRIHRAIPTSTIGSRGQQLDYTTDYGLKHYTGNRPRAKPNATLRTCVASVSMSGQAPRAGPTIVRRLAVHYLRFQFAPRRR